MCWLTLVFHALVLSSGAYQQLCRYIQNTHTHTHTHTLIKSDWDFQFHMYMYCTFVCLDCYLAYNLGMEQNVLEFKYSFNCVIVWFFLLSLNLNYLVKPCLLAYACHMQLLLYVTTSSESNQAHMARWLAYQESVMSGNTYVRKTQVRIACSIMICETMYREKSEWVYYASVSGAPEGIW